MTTYLGWIDLLVVAVALGITIGFAVYLKRYVRGVEDFLAAGRIGGRYMICTASMEALSGVVGIVAFMEVYQRAGMSLGFFGPVTSLIGLFLALTGFVSYRYRETRVLTLAQFFEIRYSANFRVFAGILIFISGIINFGIFPAVGARFFVYFCGLPTEIHLFGILVPTFLLIMAGYLTLALYFTLTGGQLTIMVTDCLEGLLSGVLYLVVAGAIILMFSWTQIKETLLMGPPGKSFVDPFDVQARGDFNLWFVLVGWLLTVYTYKAWQGQQGYAAAGLNAHEQKMAGILGRWREFGKSFMMVMVGLGGLVYLNHPDFAAGAAAVHAALAGTESNLHSQLAAPVALGQMLPIGVKGAFCAIMIWGMLANDSSMMHSFGSVFVQDVLLPFRKKPLSEKQNMRWLRWSIFGVAVFAFVFSALFQQVDFIVMFQIVTSAVYMAGAGAVIIGGLYWKRGTVAAAWAAMVSGSSLALGALLIQQVWKDVHPHLVEAARAISLPEAAAYLMLHPEKLPIPGHIISLSAALLATVVYLSVSLLGRKSTHDMEKLLNRGAYRVEAQKEGDSSQGPRRFRWSSLIGIDPQFTRTDRFIAGFMFFWGIWWAALALGITAWNAFFSRWPAEWFANYEGFRAIIIGGFFGLLTTVWFTIGTARDLWTALKILKSGKRPDDGIPEAAGTHANLP